VRTLLTQRVDGIIVTAKKTDVRLSIGSLPVPVVYAYAHSRTSPRTGPSCPTTWKRAAWPPLGRSVKIG
jgi:DNA-binding LacI/PurR family transcriptional regulator